MFAKVFEQFGEILLLGIGLICVLFLLLRALVLSVPLSWIVLAVVLLLIV